VVRLFNVYYPIRTLVLIFGETVIVCASFILAAMLRLGQDSVLVLEYENGLYKVLAITGIALLCFYYFDLYDTQRVHSDGETFFRIFIVLGVLSLVLAGVEFFLPGFLLGKDVFLLGLLILTMALIGWRWLYGWLMSKPFLRERVYVLGSGERAQRLVEALRKRPDLGLEVVEWAGAAGEGSLTREQLASQLISLREKGAIDHLIVAMSDGRGKMPVRELLDLRLSGVKIDDATGLLEKISGKIEVHELHPSWLIFSEGFRLNYIFLALRRLISITLSLVGLTLCLPLIPLIALAIKVSSPGPVFYRQKRVGLRGCVFICYKFLTMRADAEADTGAILGLLWWAAFCATFVSTRFPRCGTCLTEIWGLLGRAPNGRNSYSNSPNRFLTTTFATSSVRASQVGLKSVTSMEIRSRTPAKSCNTISFISKTCRSAWISGSSSKQLR